MMIRRTDQILSVRLSPRPDRTHDLCCILYIFIPYIQLNIIYETNGSQQRWQRLIKVRTELERGQETGGWSVAPDACDCRKGLKRDSLMFAQQQLSTCKPDEF